MNSPALIFRASLAGTGGRPSPMYTPSVAGTDWSPISGGGVLCLCDYRCQIPSVRQPVRVRWYVAVQGYVVNVTPRGDVIPIVTCSNKTWEQPLNTLHGLTYRDMGTTFKYTPWLNLSRRPPFTLGDATLASIEDSVTTSVSNPSPYRC